jgi:hypothetical protein
MHPTFSLAFRGALCHAHSARVKDEDIHDNPV